MAFSFIHLYNLSITILLFQAAYMQENKPIVETKHGKISGLTENIGQGNKVTRFLGIPYAKPPLGKLRFMKPVLNHTWNDVLHAEEYGPACHEFIQPFGQFKYLNVTLPDVIHSENCLFLNIFVPGDFNTRMIEPKAVMVYIFGGALVMGNSNIYEGHSLSFTENVIVITFNFRLGLFGFMATDDGTLPGNMGLYDQRAALVWVNENIHLFGGDAKRITIFGQSAGATTVAVHLVSPLATSLFSRAIIQSPPSINQFRTKKEQYELVKIIVFKDCGKFNTTKELLNCLQNLSVDKFSDMHNTAAMLLYFYLCIDGEYLTENLNDLISSGRYDRSKRVVIGYTRDDGDQSIVPLSTWIDYTQKGINLDTARSMISSSFMLQIEKKSNQDTVNNFVFEKYVECSKTPAELARSILNIRTDVWFGSIIFQIADMLSQFGTKVYLYRFDHFTNYFNDVFQPNIKLYSGHGHELLYVWGSGLVPARNVDITTYEKMLSASIMKSFGEFAKTGKPKYITKSQKIVKWKSYSQAKKRFLVFSTNMRRRSLQPVPEEIQNKMTFLNIVVPQIWKIRPCNDTTK